VKRKKILGTKKGPAFEVNRKNGHHSGKDLGKKTAEKGVSEGSRMSKPLPQKRRGEKQAWKQIKQGRKKRRGAKSSERDSKSNSASARFRNGL